MTHVETIVLGAITALIGWYSKMVGSRVADLPRDYVPRAQIDARFMALEARLEKELANVEARTDKRFDSVDAKLDRILERLDQKADKQ